VAREVEWVRPLGEGVQKRHWHATEKGRVVAFAVQLELWIEHRWQPILRYDAAHGFAHRDVYETATRKRKEVMGMSLRDALTYADRDIDDSWPQHVEAFRRRIQK
jgi:hypothetical protein